MNDSRDVSMWELHEQVQNNKERIERIGENPGIGEYTSIGKNTRIEKKAKDGRNL